MSKLNPTEVPTPATGPDDPVSATSSAIRSALYRLTPDARDNASPDSSPFLSRNVCIVVLGGGHETSYGYFLGYVGAGLVDGLPGCGVCALG